MNLYTQTPTVTRFFAALSSVLLAMLLGAAPASASTWTADQAVARALENPEIEVMLEAELAAARAEVDERTAWPTPELGVDYEHVFGGQPVGYVQVTTMIRQRVDFTPWRRRLRETVPHRESAARAESEQWRLEVATAVRTSFYEVRYHEERLAAIDAWIARLEQGVATMDARRERGDASSYEVRRVERELEIAVARRAEEQARLAEAWATLGEWTPWDTQPRLRGELPPRPVPDDDAADVVSLPRLAQLEQRQLVLGRELDAWGVPFGRGWTFGAGYRFARQGASNGHGFMLTLSLPLTLWNTDRPRVERLRAEHARVEGELHLRRSLAEQAADATRERLRASLDALAQLPAPERDGELSRLAEAAFAAGEGSLLELLDAYESEVDLQLSRIDLQWEARRAAIELQRRLGIGASS
jgi:cobalt-zinc-cadmium efflux system outer membrane protein